MTSSKTDINSLTKKTPFKDAASVLLHAKVKKVNKLITKYNNDKSVGNLHKLRIAFRRLRFSFENFKPCYKKKDIKYVLNCIKSLQDLLGEIRDLDVLMDNLHNLGLQLSENDEETLVIKIASEKERIEAIVSSELILFSSDNKIQSFFK